MQKSKSGGEPLREPLRRSGLRSALGRLYYGALRRLMWLTKARRFARDRGPALPFVHFSHQTPLLRRLKDVDMRYQRSKVVNLRLAAKALDGVLIRPGEVFSYWRLIGPPAKRRGFVDGMVLHNGTVGTGVGGGLCQMSNLVFWMALHTGLTVVERHRHGFDVFPDADRTQPFGSGATCYYPHGDLMLRNDTETAYRLSVRVGAEFLEGAIEADAPAKVRYEIVERNHEIRSEYWGGYSRRNELYRRAFDLDGGLLREEFVLSNAALMMYNPLLPEKHAAG